MKSDSLASIIVLCVASVSLPLTVCCWGASAAPAPRLARSLSAPASAAHAARARHNAALEQLFSETGIPLGSDPANVALRTRSLELINYAVSNNVELASESGVTASDIAYAASDFVGRYILGETQSVERLSLPNPRSSRWPSLRSTMLAAHPSCAACGAKANTVHHIVPFHLAPGRELDADNLICLCDRCHFLIGHLGDWRAFNPRCLIDADEWLARCQARPYGYATNQTVLVVGDSHAACRLPHSSVDAQIIADLLGVCPSNRLAVSGSTARKWATDADGSLLRSACERPADIVVVSLGGNDYREYAAKGCVTFFDQLDLESDLIYAFTRLASGRRAVVYMMYADPLWGSDAVMADAVLTLNSFVYVSALCASKLSGVPFFALDERNVLSRADYDGTGEIHPSASGYTNMALFVESLKGKIK